MAFPASAKHIAARGQFKAVLQEVKRCLANGMLRQIKPPPEHPYPGTVIEDIRRVPDDGPWPNDIIEAYFEDYGGQRYKLQVETYHGSGGTWEMIP